MCKNKNVDILDPKTWNQSCAMSLCPERLKPNEAFPDVSEEKKRKPVFYYRWQTKKVSVDDAKSMKKIEKSIFTLFPVSTTVGELVNKVRMDAYSMCKHIFLLIYSGKLYNPSKIIFNMALSSL